MSKRKSAPSRRSPEDHLKHRRRLFKIADRHAEEALFLASFACEDLITESTDVLDELVKASLYYNKKDFEAAGGAVQCACYEAGLAFGLAFGRRLRGA